MTKTEELITIIAPSVGVGLLALLYAGALPMACFPAAAAMGAALLLSLALVTAAFDLMHKGRKHDARLGRQGIS
jgi:hypothetical protein